MFFVKKAPEYLLAILYNLKHEQILEDFSSFFLEVVLFALPKTFFFFVRSLYFLI